MQPMEALIFLIRIVVGLYITVLLLRMLFQLVRADFYNPASQAIVKVTSPLVMPLRRVLPPLGAVDSASLLLALLFQVVLLCVVLLLKGVELSWLAVGVWSLFGLLHRLIDIYTVALFVVVIVSWVAPHVYNPIVTLCNQLTNPLLRPIRSVVPPVGGLDFSVMIALLILYMMGAFFIPPSPV